MQWFKFNIFLILFFSTLYSHASNVSKFSSGDCLASTFNTTVKHEDRFFGLLESSLSIKKNKCNFSVKYQGILDTVWSIDICREPIHIKVKSKGSQNIYKREEICKENNKSDFCYFRNELVLKLQDEGLIFAAGEREKIDDSHGQIYCSYLLITKYLDDGVLFSQYNKSIDIYTKVRDEGSCEVHSLKSDTNAEVYGENSVKSTSSPIDVKEVKKEKIKLESSNEEVQIKKESRRF